MSKLVHLIADYGEDDPAASEVVHNLKSKDRDIEVQYMSMPKFSTISTGFWINQIACENPQIKESLVYSNTAPRKGDKNARKKNGGEKLLYAEVEDGIPVIAVNSGYTFSFIRGNISELRKVEVPSKGSQFRSRDYFPEAVAKILNEEKNILGEEVSLERIPEKPDTRVAFVDGYGNIKTSIRESEIEFEPGDRARVEIEGAAREAVFENATFSVPEGEISFATGSSGGNDPFMELFLRGGSASQKFGNPSTNSRIRIEK